MMCQYYVRSIHSLLLQNNVLCGTCCFFSGVIKMEIKILNKDDWKCWKDIRLESLKNAPTAYISSFEEVEEQPDIFFQTRVEKTKIYGAFINGQLVSTIGFSIDARLKEQHRGHISGMYTRPEFCQKGIGSKLLKAVITDASNIVLQIHLSCVADNQSAIHLYQKYGFEIYGKDPRTIKIGSKFYDTLLMVLFFK